MRKLFGTIFFLLSIIANNVFAQVSPALHVDGKYLKDEAGNKVVLHGVMDSPNPNVNGCRWGIVAVDDSIPACLAYFDKVLEAITDKEHGAHADVFRFHLDPVWTNNPNAESDGQYVGDADISRFSANRLKNYLKKLYWKVIENALQRGLYVIVRAPGMCQGNVSVGGTYQDYLLDVWDVVTSNDSIMKYQGQISFELAEEPVVVTDKNGYASPKALRDFFQPIVDLIREKGFEGVLWLPGISWQTDYRDYIDYPIKDENYGFAVHDRAGWFKTSENDCEHSMAITNFESFVPVVRTNPIIVTDVDWSPINEASGHYNENGDWVLSNYGTKGTATTSKWGMAYKAILDYFGNIGMTVSQSQAYVDIEGYIDNGVLAPAYTGVKEACGEALFEWYAEWAKVNYPSNERYQPYQQIPDNPFSFESDCFCTDMLFSNSAEKHADGSNIMHFVANGSEGWRFEDSGLDISGYDSLVFELSSTITKGATLKILSTANFWGDAYTIDLRNAGDKIVVALHDMVTESGNKVDPANIRIVAFQVNTPQDISVKNISLLLADGIENVKQQVTSVSVIYDLMGRPVNRNNISKGIYIVDGKKVRY